MGALTTWDWRHIVLAVAGALALGAGYIWGENDGEKVILRQEPVYDHAMVVQLIETAMPIGSTFDHVDGVLDGARAAHEEAISGGTLGAVFPTEAQWINVCAPGIAVTFHFRRAARARQEILSGYTFLPAQCS